MKKILSSTAVATVLILAFTALLLADSRGTIDLTPGDEVYACACGSECDCGTLSRVANICGCGRELVKSRVVKVDAEEATLVVNGREKVFRTTGRYSCECMKECGCGTISQKPGKCSCGRILLPLRKN
jgi:hypothetical protein